jgi:hypothetical protein
MSAPLIEAALRACTTLSSAIEATIEAKADDGSLAIELINEVGSDLVEAYNLLTNQLSIELNLDARKLVQDMIAAEAESSRAVLRAQGVLQ